MKTTFKMILLIAILSNMQGVQAASSATSASASDSSSVSNSVSSSSGMATGTNTGSNTGTNTNVINFPSAPSSSSSTVHDTVEYKGDYTVKSTPALYAPPLTTTLTDTCMGSSSIGASFSGFGLAGGTTWTDKNCVRRLDAREFRAMGMGDVAVALLCQNIDNRMAVEATGRRCPGTPPMVAISSASENVVETASTVPPEKAAAVIISKQNSTQMPPTEPDPLAPFVLKK